MAVRDQHVHLHGGGFPGVFYDLGAIERIASMAQLDDDGKPGEQPKQRVVFRRLTGQSAGSVAATAYAAGVSVDAIAREVAFWTHAPGGLKLGNVAKVIRAIYTKIFPEDGHLAVMANNVAILTTKPGYVPFSGETVVIDRFDSKEDVISAVLASCHIPFISDLGYRSSPLGYIDGLFGKGVAEHHKACDLMVDIDFELAFLGLPLGYKNLLTNGFEPPTALELFRRGSADAALGPCEEGACPVNHSAKRVGCPSCIAKKAAKVSQDTLPAK